MELSEKLCQIHMAHPGRHTPHTIVVVIIIVSIVVSEPFLRI